MPNRTSIWKISLATAVALSAALNATAGSVTLRSGNGSGSTDTAVHMLIGPADSPFSSAFSSSNFAAADTGPNAFIIGRNPAWLSALSSDSLSKWLGTSASAASAGSTALYSIGFVIDNPFSSATLQLNYAVDNLLGGGPNQGVFLNGVAVSGNSTGGTYTSESSLSRSDVASLLHVGSNTLYINASDQGGPAGLIFRANITTVDATVPEPGTFALGCLALLALSLRAGKFNRKLTQYFFHPKH